MAALGDFDRYVLPFCADAPTPAVEDAVRDACIEFCARTNVLRVFLDPVTLTSGTFEYEIDPPDGDTQITSVLAALIPDSIITPLTRPELDANYPDGWARLTVGGTRDVKGFYCRLPGFIQLIPSVNVKVPAGLTLEVAYAPSRDATQVDDVLYQRYAEVIADGALARLHAHPDAAYADASRALLYQGRFEEAMTNDADDSTRGFARKQLRTEPEIL